MDKDTSALLDIAAYIQKAADNGAKAHIIINHVKHDIDGLILCGNDEFWVPRTKGWNKG